MERRNEETLKAITEFGENLLMKLNDKSENLSTMISDCEKDLKYYERTAENPRLADSARLGIRSKTRELDRLTAERNAIVSVANAIKSALEEISEDNS